MEESEKAGAKSESKCCRRLRLVVERGVIELQLFECIAQRLILGRIGRIKPGKHEASYRSVARQRFSSAVLGVENGITGARLAHGPHACHDVAYFARTKLVRLHLSQLVVPDFVHFVN